MSGRWRSRHWRGGEGGEQDQSNGIRDRSRERHHQAQGASHEIRDRSRERYQGQQNYHNGNGGWGGGEDRDFNNRRANENHNYDGPDRSNESTGFDQQRHRHQQQHHRGLNPDNMPRSSWNDHSSQDRGGDWRRGQHLSSSNHSQDGSVGERDRQHIKQEPASGRPGSAGRARPTFSAAPKRAWSNNGNNKPSEHLHNNNDGRSKQGNRDTNDASAAKSRNATTKKESRGWGKPDAIQSDTEVAPKKKENKVWPRPDSSLQKAADSSSAQTAQAKTSSVPNKPSNNARKSSPAGVVKREDIVGNDTQARSKTQAKGTKSWAKPATAEETKSRATENSAFPTLNPEGNNNKASSAPKEATSSFSLPSTSSWGKSMLPPSQSAPTGGGKQSKNKAKVNEFPSLSGASKVPHKQHTSWKVQSSAKTVTPNTGEKASKNNNKGSTKKGAAPANLASFLSPQISGGAAGTNSKASKKRQPPNPSQSKIGPKPHHAGISSMVGVKRSAPSSATGNSMREGNANFPGGGKGGVVKKGRQRLAPRKKKLTTLKKRVLKERLRVWKEQNGIADGEHDTPGNTGGPNVKRIKTEGTSQHGAAPSEAVKSTRTLLVENFIRPEEDDLTDEDEYDEIISNLISLAGRVGKVLSVFVPRPENSSGDGMQDNNSALLESKHVGLAFVRFGTHIDVSAAKDILDGMVVGGQKIHTTILDSQELVQFNGGSCESNSAVAPSEEKDRQWRGVVLKVIDDRLLSMDVSNDQSTIGNESSAQLGASSMCTIIFHNILCDDDYDDEEALQESIEDIKGLAQQYGQVVGARASTSGGDKGNVFIDYGNCDAAQKALQQLNGIVVGGSTIVVSTNNGLPHEQKSSLPGEIILSNVLNDDDFEDEDCLNESIDDIKNLVQKYGAIGVVKAEMSGEHKGRVHVSYTDGHQVAQQAAQTLNGMVVGGLTISASVVSATENNANSRINQPPVSSNNNSSKPEPPPPMYSGDKIVPERFAACKRVPKIPNKGTPRAYASKISNEEAIPLVIEMLGELMRLQERSKDDKNARARRRLVMGLREVARGIRAHKVKMVIMANNLDQYGAIDAKLQEILDLARAEDLPILFELNKRKLGKSLGKSIKVSVVGIQNAEGAHGQFKKLKKMMGMA